MDIEELQQHWEAFAQANPMWAVLTSTREWDERAFFETGVQEIDAIMQHIAALSIQIAHDRALDFGCGLGRLSQALARHFEHVDGIDIAPSMIEQARKFNQFGDRVEYRVNSVDNLRVFEDSRFNFIYSNITLQHMSPRYSKNYILEFLRVLKPGGLCVFQVPSELKEGNSLKAAIKGALPDSVMESYRSLKFRLKGGGPRMEMHGIPKQQVIELVEKHGGRVLDAPPDTRATGEEHWTHFVYYVTKPA
jgi:SAM-dependent methyltransferase